MCGELIKALCSFLTPQSSQVKFWLVCWFAAGPHQDHNLRLSHRFLCMPPRRLLLQTSLLSMSFFPALLQTKSAPSGSKAARWHDRPHPGGDTALTGLEVVGKEYPQLRTPQTSTVLNQSSVVCCLFFFLFVLFFNEYHFSIWRKPLVNFQSLEIVIFDNSSPFCYCFIGRGFAELLTAPYLLSWLNINLILKSEY